MIVSNTFQYVAILADLVGKAFQIYPQQTQVQRALNNPKHKKGGPLVLGSSSAFLNISDTMRHQSMGHHGTMMHTRIHKPPPFSDRSPPHLDDSGCEALLVETILHVQHFLPLQAVLLLLG